MAISMRLKRMGKKKRPFYRIVVADSESPRDGRFLEVLGTYNPLIDPPDVTLNEERVIYWLKEGALLSDTVRSILKKKGVLSKAVQ